jgi:curved DNA-binding protein CbpA
MENYQDALKILGLEHGASEEDIKRAYFHLVRKYTPEKDPEAFQKIHEAYLLVKDAEKKAEYTFHDLSIGQLPEIHLSLKIIRP